MALPGAAPLPSASSKASYWIKIVDYVTVTPCWLQQCTVVHGPAQDGWSLIKNTTYPSRPRNNKQATKYITHIGNSTANTEPMHKKCRDVCSFPWHCNWRWIWHYTRGAIIILYKLENCNVTGVRYMYTRKVAPPKYHKYRYNNTHFTGIRNIPFWLTKKQHKCISFLFCLL